ncbi:hypothetical protein BJP25_05780 [Actinokineospora bangkokensis]|uniref:N-acetyltransferase domain-containing protein n=1 Tax=Actinokineospora bangkokensis TaxID=1193682 RepID=A0A1Q9LC65_9PSEU|nr:hypothetical protein BJP25_05780 [Actinokineospora bangkokensis]
MLVREATADDAAALGRVHAEAWHRAYRDLFEPEWLTRFVAERRGRWHARLADPAFDLAELLVAEQGAAVVAFAWFGPHADNTADAELRAYYAHPDAWGTGVAQTLFDNVREAVADRRRLRLWTLAGAHRARRFYAKEGFARTGLHRDRDFGDARPVREVEYALSPHDRAWR